MTVEREPRRTEGAAEAPAIPELEKPRTWMLPIFFVTVIIVLAAILVLSNTDSQELGFAGFTWEAPLWIILAITFFAGALLTRVLGRAWSAMRRRSQRKRAEYDRARKAAQ
jgi:uncharacterized integral membrane protein